MNTLKEQRRDVIKAIMDTLETEELDEDCTSIQIVEKCDDYLLMYNHRNGTTIFMEIANVKPQSFMESICVVDCIKADMLIIKNDGLVVDGKFIHRRYYDYIEDESSIDTIIKENKLFMR